MQYRKKSHRLRYKTGERTVYIKYTELNSNKHQIKKTNAGQNRTGNISFRPTVFTGIEITIKETKSTYFSLTH